MQLPRVPLYSVLKRCLAVVVAAVLVAAFIAGTALPSQAAALPALLNPNFVQINAAGAPLDWKPWNPAGTAIVSIDAAGGPNGEGAVSITATAGTATRYALTQSVAVTDDMPRNLVVSAMVKGANLSGFNMLRVQAYNAANQVVVPVAKGPYLLSTFDWQPYAAEITIPPGTSRISIEPMLDRSDGSISWSDMGIAEQTPGTGSLQASATAQGTVELRWSMDAAADHFTVYRTTGSTAPAPSPEHALRDASAATTADDTVLPGTTYSYVVVAKSADGTVLATSPSAIATTPEAFEDRIRNTTLTALETAGGVHVSWALGEDEALDGMTVQIDTAAPQALPALAGSLELQGAAGESVFLKSDGANLASAVVGSAAHPRAITDADAMARVRGQLAAGEATATGAWKTVMERLASNDSPYPSNGSAGLYRGRDSAFAYSVTGEQHYAQAAFDAAMSAEGFVMDRDLNMGLELGRANLLLAPIYDWSYNAWTEAQRKEFRSLMRRSADLLSTYHHGGLDDPVKTSNWVGVVRSTELALLLAARGDGDFGNYDSRINFLIDQTAQHLDQAYTGTGFTQEGWDYLHYTELYMFPSILFAQGTGIQVLDAPMLRPQFWNLALHAVSTRSKGDTLQFGVSGPNGQVDGSFPLMFPFSPEDSLPGLKHLYDNLQGVNSDKKGFDGVHSLWAVLYNPEAASSNPADLTAGAAHSALLEDEEGFYAFRNKYEDRSDTLIGTANRNQQHRGWSSAETFSLTWIGQDTTWATLGGKGSQNPLLWSKPLVDGKLEPYRNEYETVTGAGITEASRAFAGQGGGYIRLDGSGNFLVDTAKREEVVDLAQGKNAIVAIQDTFADSVSHRWDWQLRPEAGVQIAINGQPADGEPLFTFTSPNGAVLSGFVMDADGMDATVIDGTLRLSKTGEAAQFSVVLVTSDNGAVTGKSRDGGLFEVEGRTIDFTNLEASTANGLPEAPPEVPADNARTAPAVGQLSSNNGHDTGLLDGDYTVTMNMWWGENATSAKLYEDGVLVGTKPLDMASPSAQTASFDISGKANGSYRYVAELVNSQGTTSTRELVVTVRDANPAKPQLSHNNWSGSGHFTLTTNLWWGTNATHYRFYDGDAVIGEGSLNAATPAAQRATLALDGQAPGSHKYRVEFSNAAGATFSDWITIRVTGK